MKRAIGSAGRKGTPPLPRQRRALRVTQLTLLLLAGWAAKLAVDAAAVDDRAGLIVAAVVLGASGLWMGIRTVRGPEPPQLD